MIKVGILIINPHTLWKKGGGEVQAGKYPQLGNDDKFKIEYFDFRNPDYDIIHYFGHGHQIHGIGKHARDQGIKVIGTPILYPAGKAWAYRAFLKLGQLIPFGTALNLRQELILASDAILANSEPEKEFIAKAYQYPISKIKIIGSGVDASYLEYRPERNHLPRAAQDLKDYLLMVGRVTPLKSQLEVAKLIIGTGENLLMVGQPDSSESDYCNELSELVDSHDELHWIKGVSPDSNELLSVYTHASCHILWSTTEVAALVNMESAALGCPTICRNLPSTMSLMKEHSLYASNERELLDRIKELKSWSEDERKQRIEAARSMIAASHTWERIIEKSKELYQALYES